MSDTNTCRRCERPVTDAAVCNTCHRDTDRALGEVPWLDEQLELAVTRQTNYADAYSDGSRNAETPPAFNVQASRVRSHLKAILVGWCRLIVDETGAAWPDDNAAAISRFLLRRTEWMRHHEAAFEFVDEITSAVRDCWPVVDSPRNRTTFTVGPCPEQVTDDLGHESDCPGEVRAFIPTDLHEGPTMQCDYCKTTWSTIQFARAGMRIKAKMEAAR